MRKLTLLTLAIAVAGAVVSVWAFAVTADSPQPRLMALHMNRPG